MKYLWLLIWLIATIAVSACDAGESWQERLYTPTQFVRLGDTFFIVDCWHNRALYSRTLEADLTKWNVLDNDLAGPHSIDTNGVLYIVEDTGRHKLKVYSRAGGGFQHIQTVDGVGIRPHRVVFDNKSGDFFVIGSASQTISRLKPRSDRSGVDLIYTQKLEFLRGAYTRSMTIIGDEMYFVSGPGKIIKSTFRDGSYTVLDEYPVPKPLASMNDLFYSGNYFYLTATPKQIIRVKRMDDLKLNTYEDVYSKIGFQGTPYYLFSQGRRLYVPQITQYSGLISFVEDGSSFKARQVHFDFGAPTMEDAAEKGRLPK